MLDKLPLELVQQIIRLVLPSSYSPLTYRERQDTLLSLCRTSKPLAALAQPVLLEVVELTSDKTVELFFEEVEDAAKGGRVKIVRIDGDFEWSEQYDGPEEVLRELAARCRSVVELRVQAADVDLCWLEAFVELRRFICNDADLSASRPFSLDKLEEFSAVYFDLFNAVSYILSPSAYPRLQVFHLEICRKGLPPQASFLPFLPHVNTFSCDNTDTEHAGVVTPGVGEAHNVLILADFEELWVPLKPGLQQAKHLRLNKYPSGLRDANNCGVDDPEYVVELLHDLAVHLRISGLHNLSTLFLPLEYDPTTPSDILDDSQRSRMMRLRTFLATCTSIGVEVVFEESPHPYFDSGVSPEFRRRCRAGGEEGDGEGDDGTVGRKRARAQEEVYFSAIVSTSEADRLGQAAGGKAEDAVEATACFRRNAFSDTTLSTNTLQ